MSINLLYAENDEWLLLSPCSSCETYVGPHDIPHEIETPHSSPHDITINSNPSDSASKQLTIILPNLVDRVTISMGDVEEFVSGHLDPCPQISVTHLLIYLLLRNLDSAVTCINNLKLLHTGKQYRVLTLQELEGPLPPLEEVAARFPTFQLFISPHLASPAISINTGMLLAKTAEGPNTPEMISATTYAESIVQSFKRMKRKSLVSKNSVGRRSSAVLTTSLQNSSTDVEEKELLPKGSLRRSWRWCLRRSSLPAHVGV